MKFMLTMLLLGASLVMALPAVADEVPPQPVAHLDLSRYQGTWYEIARYPNSFQAPCVSGDMAQYRILPNGTYSVLNSCRKADGSVGEISGEARPDSHAPDASGQLQVRFAPTWLKWLPLVWARYWVIVLDPDYRYAVVSEPTRHYLWILSRTPALDSASYGAILDQLAAQGYDLSKLIKTTQP